MEKRRSKRQIALDYDHIEFLVSIMPPEDQSKIDFAEEFLHKYLFPNAKDDDIIKLEDEKYPAIRSYFTELLRTGR